MRLGPKQRKELLTRPWGTYEEENEKPTDRLIALGLVEVKYDDEIHCLTPAGKLVCSLLREIDRARSEGTQYGYEFAKDKW